MPPKPVVPNGGRVLEFDMPGLSIGVAEYEEGPTGCTVFAFEGGAVFSADIRGGSNGTIGTDYGFGHAICFAGGSLLGLESASGVAVELFERRGHPEVVWNDVPLVAGAIIFDFKSGRRSAVYPDRELGRAAMRAAVPGRFPMGQRGAGRLAGVGAVMSFDRGEPAGQGGAFRQAGDTKIAVFTVVNALGVIVDRQGRVVRGNLDRATGKRSLPNEESALTADPRPGNTTLTMVVTNQRLGGNALTQLSR
jgi:L-aminopeptidase/D-esterase-like protein